MLWLMFQQSVRGIAYGGQQIGVAHQIRHLELQQTGLPGAEHFPRSPEFEVLLGDDEAVLGFLKALRG